MKAYAIGLLVLLSLFGVVVAQTESQPGNEAEFERKLKALRDEIDALRLKQDKLEAERKVLVDEREARQRKEEAERKAKADAEKKKHYAKVEIRGILSKKQEPGGFGFPQLPAAWHVTMNDLRWRLNFGDKKDLAEQASKLAGQPVVITGAFVNAGMPSNSNPYLIPMQPWPHPWQQQQFQMQPGSQQQIQFVQLETPVVINVETLKAAKD
jgi:hypothetical protein